LFYRKKSHFHVFEKYSFADEKKKNIELEFAKKVIKQLQFFKDGPYSSQLWFTLPVNPVAALLVFVWSPNFLFPFPEGFP
jgi:hypothetical protein